MHKNPIYLISALIVLLTVSLACKTVSGIVQPEQPPISNATGNNTVLPTQSVEPSASLEQEVPKQSEGTSPDTEFPLPSEVQNLQKIDSSDAGITFMTTLSIKDVIQFYREAFTKQDYSERQILTSIGDSTFSIVFDGAPNGKAIVVQGVDVGSGIVTVSIRYESV